MSIPRSLASATMDRALQLTKDRSKKSLLHYDRIMFTYAAFWAIKSSKRNACVVVTFRRGTKIWLAWLDCWMSVVMLRGATFVDAIEVEIRLLSADPDLKHFPSVIITQGLYAMLFATGGIRLGLVEP
jgi:hypothetical protein